MRYINIFSAVAIISTLSGCATPLNEEAKSISNDKHEYLKNYKLGVSKTVNIGDPMVKFQDYWTESTNTPVFVPNADVTLSGGMAWVAKLKAGEKYPLKGKATYDGYEYSVVAIKGNEVQHSAVLVKKDGTLADRIVNTSPPFEGYVRAMFTIKSTNPSVQLKQEIAEHVKTSKGYENFELMYTGTNSNGLNITYREFSPDGLARIAFFQNLTYEVGAKSITFKKYKILINKASSESITYTVISD